MDKFEVQFEEQKNKLNFDPRTKVFALLMINIVMISGGITGIDFYLRIILSTIPLILLATRKKYKLVFVFVILFAVCLFGEGFVMQQLTGALNLIFLILSGIILRFMPGFLMGMYLINTTSVSEFVAAMERMHVSRKIIIPLSVMFRFFPTINEENRSIKAAMRMRGIGFGGGNGNPITLLECRLVPMMISVVKIGDELSAASLTKGLEVEGERTNICTIGFSIQDIILFLITGTSFVLMLIY